MQSITEREALSSQPNKGIVAVIPSQWGIWVYFTLRGNSDSPLRSE